MKRLLIHFQNNTGVFGAKKGKEWYTSQNNVSDGYSLLFSLYMDPIHSKTLKKMSDEAIWKSHEHFQCYSLDDFAVYNKNMLELTNRRKELIAVEEESFRRDMLKIPPREKTSRGEPFWHTVLSGRWNYCEEYIGENVIKYGKMMAHIGRRKVVFELKDDVELGRTVDCCTFMIHEMRLDPSSQWFDWKV